MNLNQTDFALVTSDSLPKRIKSWDSYEHLSEDQFIDLIDYSKELVKSSPEHEILFLVVAKGEDKVEVAQEQEIEKLKKDVQMAELEKQEDIEKQNELRENSKKILNSIYGI